MSPVIARVWRGWAPSATAEDYARHFRDEVSTSLRGVPGFLGARLLRVADGDEVLFTSITLFSGLDAVIGFAGADYAAARVEPAARAVLSRWDGRVTHHEVAVDLDTACERGPQTAAT